MDVTLVFIGIKQGGFDSFAKYNSIHHGLATIASYLTKYNHKVDYIDLRRLKGWDDFKKIIEGKKPAIYGISSTSIDFDIAVKAAKIIKKSNKNNLVVLGGVHATLVTKDAESEKCFDVIVVGEGEIAMKRIVEMHEKKQKIPRIIRGEPCKLEEIPHIDRDLFFHREGEMISPINNDLGIPFATIISSRGCPFNCAFCQPAERQIFGGVVRIREMSDVVDEIYEIKQKYGLKSFLIHDDLFTLSKPRLEEFISLYKKKKIKAKFMCQARADLIVKYKSTFKELKEIGLEAVMIGFESGSQRILEFINKKTTVEQNIEAAKICKEYGIKIWANYMLGIPTEKYSDIMATLGMIKKIKPDYYSPTLFTPFPETGLYDYCKKK